MPSECKKMHNFASRFGLFSRGDRKMHNFASIDVKAFIPSARVLNTENYKRDISKLSHIILYWKV